MNIFREGFRLLDRLKEKGFTIHCESHAQAILERDFLAALNDIDRTFCDVEVPITEIIGSGGGESKGTQRMRRSLADLGWAKTNFEIRKIVNGVEKQAISHEIDHVKNFDQGVIALEIEWNNKDPFFDRDLENFKRLHAESAISVGVIVTRAEDLHNGMFDFVRRFAHENRLRSLEDLTRIGLTPTIRQKSEVSKRTDRARNPISFEEAWASQFVSDKYGEATTHWRKLMDRVRRGVGNPCPLLLVGLPASIVRFDPEASQTHTAMALERAAAENDGDPST